MGGISPEILLFFRAEWWLRFWPDWLLAATGSAFVSGKPAFLLSFLTSFQRRVFLEDSRGLSDVLGSALWIASKRNLPAQGHFYVGFSSMRCKQLARGFMPIRIGSAICFSMPDQRLADTFGVCFHFSSSSLLFGFQTLAAGVTMGAALISWKSSLAQLKHLP